MDVNLHGEMAYKAAETPRWRSIPFIFTTGCERTMLSHAYPDVPHIPATLTAICDALSRTLVPMLNDVS